MKKIIISVLAVFILIWGAVAAVDFSKVNDFEKPIFCVTTETADDGGSGRYVGLGYWFDIEGSFMPEDENYRVTYFDAYLFGMDVLHGIAD